MTWSGLSEPAQVVGGIGGAVGAFIAAWALFLGFLQLRRTAQISREAGALQAYRDYLKLCFDHPAYSSYNLFFAAHPDLDVEKIVEAETSESERYLWFVSILLNTCEQIATYVSSQGGWRSTLVAQLGYHRGTLEVVWPLYKDHYDDNVDLLVTEMLRSPD